MTDYLMIGEVLKPQGLKGECKIRPFASDITLFQSGLSGRHALIWFVDDHAVQLQVLLYQRAYACILTRKHSLEVLHFLRRIVLCIWIE